MEPIEIRKRGRVAGPVTERYQVLLDEDVAEWAKRLPGGLSATIRRLLRQEYETAATSVNENRLSGIHRLYADFVAKEEARKDAELQELR